MQILCTRFPTQLPIPTPVIDPLCTLSNRACRPSAAQCRPGRTGHMRSNTTASGSSLSVRASRCDWSKQLPAITEALQALPVRSVVLDGEGVICGADGKSDFDRPLAAKAGAHATPEAFLYAFDVLELDGRDLRPKPWATRREALVSLLAGAGDGIRLCEHIEDVDGAVVFRQACLMGLEGIVAKRRDSRYHSGRCREWIKIKNPAHQAIERAMLIALSKRGRS